MCSADNYVTVTFMVPSMFNNIKTNRLGMRAVNLFYPYTTIFSLIYCSADNYMTVKFIGHWVLI